MIFEKSSNKSNKKQNKYKKAQSRAGFYPTLRYYFCRFGHVCVRCVMYFRYYITKERLCQFIYALFLGIQFEVVFILALRVCQNILLGHRASECKIERKLARLGCVRNVKVN